MKKKIFTTGFFAAIIFYTGFYTGQQFNVHTTSSIADTPLGNFKRAVKISHPNTHQKKTKKNNKSFSSVAKNNFQLETDDSSLLPHEQDSTEEALMEIEEQFAINQDSELAMFESMLASMEKDNLPEDEIEMIKFQIDTIKSEQFNENLAEQNESDEILSVERMRENFSESLIQHAGELSDEEREEMVSSMFPDEELMSTDEDTIILPHEMEKNIID